MFQSGWVPAAVSSFIRFLHPLLLKDPSRNSLSPIAGEGSDTGASILDVPGPEERAVATTLYSEAFASGALALGHSLRSVNTSARRILLYYPDRLTIRTLCHLQTNGWELHPVTHRSDQDERDLKFRLWTLDSIGIKSVVYLESDSLVRRNFDELWSLPFAFAAVPDVYEDNRGFPLAFSAGMMLLRASSTIHDDMQSKISVMDRKRPVGFQTFLNMYFAAQVLMLPCIYNADLAIKQRSPALWSSITDHTRIVRYAAARPFFEEERRRAVKGIWATEMEWWEMEWRETFEELENRC